MQIGVISGSHRDKSESDRVSQYVIKDLKTSTGVDTYYFSLAQNPLPLWDEEALANSERWQNMWGPISAELKRCDGFVIVSPEWSGMVPAGLKNFFLLCGRNELAHKPGLIIGVSAGVGGSYPVAELRMSSYKNTRLCYIPDHVIVRNVGSMLKGDLPSNDHDKSVRARIGYANRMLVEYSKALCAVRASDVIDFKSFPSGM